MQHILNFVGELPYWLRLISFIVFAVMTHLLVILVRMTASYFLSGKPSKESRKLRSLATLAISAVIFSIYFLAVGLILREFGVSLMAYLASASVLGLALGFGSQGIVQDVVMGLTFIFSDLVDVGDLVEISGQTGIVKGITLRFIELENALGANVFIPNRTIVTVVNYPRGYVRCIVDVTLRGDENNRTLAIQSSRALMESAQNQFHGILMSDPSSVGRIKLSDTKEILRLKFRIWPNRGQPIETSFVQELVAELKLTHPEYQAWMIAVTYEIEKKTIFEPSKIFNKRNK